ncbi:MAG: UDP-N-acetylmuramoyl-L-alanyl-D-glutamate--2,6-diaminopimelate ligase, partial [Deltaproteobacteria bacterium]|nr:UDP-N-acetylmuramoyl-L-alanyl-D-glutamate--2,6-diaminopimelate ligase [Deltaproteobacteria bacterium]
MNLINLIESLSLKEVIGSPEVDIQGIAYDSRRVRKGFLFIALRGQNQDGHSFVQEATERGASAILLERPIGGMQNVTQVVVSDAREAMATVSSTFYGKPSERLTLIGVTGTNGKTTITYLIESILREAGYKVGIIGTINYRYPGYVLLANHTTPEAPDVQRILGDMVNNGITHCGMEVSSHALSQMRVDGCRFAGAVFTNLTQDHLEYHRTMED